MEKKILRVLIYMIDNEFEIQLRKLASANDLRIVSVVRDEAVDIDGMTYVTRDGATKILDSVGGRGWSAVLAKDRASLNRKDMAHPVNIAEYVEKFGKGVITIGDLSFIEKFHSKKTSPKSITVINRSFNVPASKILDVCHATSYRGPAPFGYKKCRDVLEQDPAESSVLKMIFSLYLDMRSTIKVANYLNEKGYKTRSSKNWSVATIVFILKNAVYTEENSLEKSTMTKTVKSAIIPKNIFDKVQRLLKNNSKK